jgi:hypothetical protein
MGPRCSSAETQVCHRSYIIAATVTPIVVVQVRYIIIETKEVARIGYNGFLFPTHLGLHLSTHAEKETRYIQYGPLLLFH